MKMIPTLEEMLEAGVHFGHREGRWHPKMAPYIFGVRGDIHIINLEETQKALGTAMEFVRGVAARGGTLLFVGTKPQAKTAVRAAADACAMPFVTERWLGGTLTNFTEIKRLVKTFTDLKDRRSKGELKKYTKKEQLWFNRDIDDMDKKVGGIENMKEQPDVVILMDIRADKTAFEEAKHRRIPVVAIVDTNVNPESVTYPIPANDDGIKSIQIVLDCLSDAIRDGKAHPVAETKKVEKVSKVAKVAKASHDILVKASAKEAVETLDEKVKDKLAEEKEKIKGKE